MLRILTVATVMILCIGAVSAQNYKIDWYSINGGGGSVSGGGYRLNSSIGQSAAGFVMNTTKLHWIGFWAGDLPDPVAMATARQAKLEPDGTYVSVSGKIATSGWDPATAMDDRFSGFFYLQEEDRSSGIRIACPTWPISGLQRGSTINVIGTMGTGINGERQITAPLVIIGATTNPPPPLGMSNISLGGGDVGDPANGSGQYGITGGFGLNNIGLLVRVWGEITYKDPSGAYMLVTDGSGDSIRIDTAGLTGLPSSGYVSVTGLSSLYTGLASLVLPRTGSDISPE